MALARKAKKAGKIVVYETLDDNVFLNFHAVSKKIFVIRPFKKLITGKLSDWEKKFSDRFCDKVLVNSPNLLEKFTRDKVIYMPYSSPLEELEIHSYDPNKETIFLYLGKLTVSKGTRQYARLLQRFNRSMYFFGKAYDKESLELVSSSLVHSKGNLGMIELKKELSALFERYNPIGLSIIIPENESYALQEANKDIDYISMGIPFIGNDRLPTYEKINSGMGVLDSNEELIEQLLNNSNGLYDHCVQACKLEAPKYSGDNFKKILLDTYNSVCA